MARWTIFPAVIAVAALVATGCSGSGGSPLIPDSDYDLTPESSPAGPNHTQLWGYYDVFVDIENQTVEAVPNRQMMYAVNVVRFINGPPPYLSFRIHDIVQGSNYVDIDIDVTIRHPFLGKPQLNGYDVRGIFMGDAYGTLNYNSSLNYPMPGTDQYMLDDPLNGDGGGPDGYTRWFNYTEFSIGGMPMFSYTQGVKASPGFDGTATLNPYKYFADSLDADENDWDFLTATENNGVFSSGAINTRNYYLRFPDAKDFEFGYAIVADWEGPDVHPSNAAEAVSCSVTDNSDIYYPDSAGDYGDLVLDISLFGWEYQPSKIYIESTVLSAVANFDPSTIATGGGEHYSTYHVEIPVDNVILTEGNECWVIAEYEEFDYSNIVGVPNLAENDYLSAFFRYDLNVEIIYDFGWARTWGGSPLDSGWEIDKGYAVAADGYGNVYYTGYFMEMVDFDPGPLLERHISNGSGDVFLSKYNSAGNFQWVRTWGGASSDEGRGVAADDSGNVYVTGSFLGTVEFDPDGGDPHASNGFNDAFLSKFDSAGNFEWALTWGGVFIDKSYGVAADNSGNIYVTGRFRDTVDFDPDGGDLHPTNGWDDVFLSKFNSSGNFEWARTWGGSEWDEGWGVAVDDSGSAYVTGFFLDTVDFDPDGGDPHTSNGTGDVFLSKFDSVGNFKWARTWGGEYSDEGKGVAADGSGNVYVSGWFEGATDFDPDGGATNTSNGVRDVYLSKFDSSGNFEWARTWGGSNTDEGLGVAADGYGNVYVTGHFMDLVDFDPDGGDLHISNGYGDVFLSKYDSSGNFQWAQTWGGWAPEYWVDVGSGVAADDSGYVYVAGYFTFLVDFAPTDPPCNANPDEHTCNGFTDAFLTKHLADGCW